MLRSWTVRGVQMLLELAKRLEWRDQTMRLVVPDDSHIRKVLMITGFEGVVAVDGSLGLARAHFANQEDDQ
jgi:hypothetical protein